MNTLLIRSLPLHAPKYINIFSGEYFTCSSHNIHAPHLYRSKATGSGSVAHLDFITFPAGQPLDIHEVSFMPLALPHGPGCNALGFVFMNVAYLSDLKGACDELKNLCASLAGHTN